VKEGRNSTACLLRFSPVIFSLSKRQSLLGGVRQLVFDRLILLFRVAFTLLRQENVVEEHGGYPSTPFGSEHVVFPARCDVRQSPWPPFLLLRRETAVKRLPFFLRGFPSHAPSCLGNSFTSPDFFVQSGSS